ncbi:DUF2829 domain-containing protein [Hominiventricola aquisgranensis]|uniref:DUF2829 domain-containing protein n=1 Tax=Hominiventricola aquisgranensis TaxID=3133164 RepID=A0ABV1I1N7_9FIRM
MKFSEAFKTMKEGRGVKLPSWGGYWCWDEEKKTVMMQCRKKDADQEDLLDIRETQRVEYTLMNMQSDEWQIADAVNCPLLGGEATFSFGEAIKYLKRGMKVARKGWNGKGMYLFLADGEDLTKCLSNNGEFKCINSICMKTAQNTICIGWLASQADMLAEDWIFAE